MFYVYLVCAEINGRRLYKIGYTRRTPEQRIKEFKTGNASYFWLVDSFKSKWGSKIEAILKKKYSYCNVSGEWFDLSESEISNFNMLCSTLNENFNLISTNNTFVIDNEYLI
jgi:hypothetical protein